MNKLSFSARFFLLKSREKDGLKPIYCRITVNRDKAEFSLNEWIDPKKWDEQAHRPKGNPELDNRLMATYLELSAIRNKINERGQIPTAAQIKDTFLRKDEKVTRLIDYVKGYVDRIEQLHMEYSKATQKKYQTIKNHLERFLEEKQLTSVTLKGFDKVRVHELEFYLKTVAKLSVNTTGKYLKLLKSIYKKAIDNDQTDANPFHGMKFKTERTNREFLTQEELDTMEAVVLPNESLKRVRDLFVFSCYSGLRFIDVNKLTPKNIVSDQNGKHWIEIRQIQKTGESLRIPLLKKAKDIIDRYYDEAEITGKLLPLRSNQKVNAYLKVIADTCNIEKHLTFHMARHTFATTVTLSNDVPIEVVSALLGHRNIKTTQIYAKITNKYTQYHMEKLDEIL